MEKKNIREIDINLINKENYYDKFKKASDFMEEVRKDLDFHINLSLYNFVSLPNIETLDELAKGLNFKKLLNNEIADAVATAYRTGELEWNEECYKNFKEEDTFHNSKDAEEILAEALALLKEVK